MKIKVIKTNEIVNVMEVPQGFGLDDAPYLRTDGKGRYSKEDIEILESEDEPMIGVLDDPYDDIWEERRYEIAKQVLALSSLDEYGEMLEPSKAAKVAVERADALIAELRK